MLLHNPVQADVGTAGAGGGRAIELVQAATLNPLQYIQGLAKAITGTEQPWHASEAYP